MKADITRLGILTAGLSLFEEQGFDDTTMREISARAGVSLGSIYRYFSTKEAMAMALYERLAGELEERAVQIEARALGARFAQLMRAKLDLIEPHAPTLLGLMAYAINPSNRLGVLSAATTHVRGRVSSLFALMVEGAEDAPAKPSHRAHLTTLLYALHLLIILIWTQDRSEGRRMSRALVDRVEAMMGPAIAIMQALKPELLDTVGEVLGPMFATPMREPAQTEAIMHVLRDRHRTLGDPRAEGVDIDLCRAQIARHVQAGEPVHFVLPAFPAKSPNPDKVLGILPDMGEWLALQSLEAMCERIEQLYEPGARVTICSDGHVFADIVHVSDEDVARYKEGLLKMLRKMKATRVDVVAMAELLSIEEAGAAREVLMDRYAEEATSLRARVRASTTLQAQVDGIHRFLFEDERAIHAHQSANQARRATRERAYEVVRRSEAWGRLVALMYPRAVRLSIHPQPPHSAKFGFHLLDTEDAWLTPWHSAPLIGDQGARLIKRSEAERLGARAVYPKGEFAYMEVPS